jgi:hypothetical protein
MKLVKQMQKGFIKASIRAMNKEQLLGIYGILILYPDTDNDKIDILESLKKEWIKREYDIKELLDD